MVQRGRERTNGSSILVLQNNDRDNDGNDDNEDEEDEETDPSLFAGGPC